MQCPQNNTVSLPGKLIPGLGAGGEPQQRRAKLLEVGGGGGGLVNAAEDTLDRGFLFFIMPRKRDAAAADEGELRSRVTGGDVCFAPSNN